MSEPQNGAELLARIKPRLREESTQISLRPDLLDAWEEAQERLAKTQMADANGTGRLAGGQAGTSRELAEEVARLEAEIDATAITFRFRAMPKDDWQALCADFPPREGDVMDSYAGYNREAVQDAAVRRCLIDPVFDEASWADLMKVMNPSEWSELREAVTRVNRSVVDPPKSLLASRILSKSASDSAQPESGE